MQGLCRVPETFEAVEEGERLQFLPQRRTKCLYESEFQRSTSISVPLVLIFGGIKLILCVPLTFLVFYIPVKFCSSRTFLVCQSTGTSLSHANCFSYLGPCSDPWHSLLLPAVCSWATNNLSETQSGTSKTGVFSVQVGPTLSS